MRPAPGPAPQSAASQQQSDASVPAGPTTQELPSTHRQTSIGTRARWEDQTLTLVRILNCTCDAPPAPRILPLGDPRGDKKKPILLVPADAISPDFKVLLYAYRQGEPLPATDWNTAHNALTIGLPGAQDVISFAPAASGKTDVKIVRNEAGKQSTVIDISKPIPNLGSGAPASAANKIP